MNDDLMRSTLDTIREANRVRRERDEARKAVRFFASVIRSGESWSEACDDAYERAMGNERRDT